MLGTESPAGSYLREQVIDATVNITNLTWNWVRYRCLKRKRKQNGILEMKYRGAGVDHPLDGWMI